MNGCLSLDEVHLCKLTSEIDSNFEEIRKQLASEDNSSACHVDTPVSEAVSAANLLCESSGLGQPRSDNEGVLAGSVKEWNAEIGGSSRESRVTLVQHDVEAAEDSPWTIQFEDASGQARNSSMARRHDGAPQDQDQRQIQPARGDRVSSSCRPESSRGQPIWPVGQVPGVSSEVGVCAVQQRESSHLQESIHQEQDGSGACGEGRSGSKCQSEEPEGYGYGRSFQQGVGDSIGEAGRLCGVRDCGGIAAPGCQHGAAAAINARGLEFDAAAGEHGCGVFELGIAHAAAADADAGASSSNVLQSSATCNPLGSGDESQRKLGSAAVNSLGSWFGLSDKSTCTEGWLISEFRSPTFAYVSSKIDADCWFLWQPPESFSTSSYIIWKDINLVGDLISSDFLDDREFQLRRRQKRELSDSLRELTKGCVKEENQYHGEDVRTSKDHQYYGEDVRTSKEPKYHGEDVRTSKDQEPFGPPLETRCLGSDSSPPKPQCQQNPKEAFFGKVVREIDSLGQVLGGHVSPSWLSCRKRHGPLKICEVFSPMRLGAQAAKHHCTTTNPASFDLSEGWNCFDAMDRALLWKTLREQEPDVVVLSPECKAFSVLMESNWNRMSEEEKNRVQTEGLAMLHLCVQIADFQIANGRFFLFEHPGGASSWATHSVGWLLRQPGVVRFLFDQCAVGLSVKEGTVSQKVTGIATNHLGVASVLSSCQCRGDHEHFQLQNGYPHLARVYPNKMLEKIWKGLVGSFNFAEGIDQSLEDEHSDSDDEAQEVPEPVSAPAASVSSIEKEKIRHMHLNMGHLPKNQMILILKAAGAKPSVLCYVRDHFNCEQCHRRQQPEIRRKAAFPRTFSFNRIVALDYFYVSWEGKTLAYLNIICHGSNFQQVARLSSHEGGTPNSAETWKLFSDLWIRPFGLPEILLTDGGGEFRHEFERRAELAGVMHIVTDAQSPWQNGRVERHGGWLKHKLENEINSGPSVVVSVEDLDLLVTSLVSHKNRWFHRGGFSPCQLVFGVNPRVPSELLGDDALAAVGLGEVQADDFELDTPGLEFNKAFKIRQRARQVCMEASAKDKVRLSSAGPIHKQQTWNAGQWVLIWRRFPGSGQGHVTRARWTGPGLVVQQSGHTVWVSLRSRLIKCNSDQLRSATHDEAIGAELSRSGQIQELLNQASSHRAGAVDITREGAPTEEDMDYQLVDRPEVIVQVPAPHAPLPVIQEESPSQPATPMPLLRAIGESPLALEPAPSRELRRASTHTVEEPLGEPIPSTPSSSATSRKKHRAEDPRGVVRKRVDELEDEKLQRETVRILKRLDREEKQAARREGRSLPSTPRTPASCPGTPGQPSTLPAATSSAQGAIAASEVEIPHSEGDEAEFPSFFQHLCGELGNALESVEEEAAQLGLTNMCFATIQPDVKNSRVISKPWKTKNGEFNMREATPEDVKGFELSDNKEWETIMQMRAVKVWSGREAEEIKKNHGDRVIDSRMIRRKKPVPGVGNWKYKSRWCVLGHHDPDSHMLSTFSPMPTAESITMFFQLSLNLNLKVSFTDITSAFCQSDPLVRDNGPLYVTPCSGLPNVEKGSVIELVAPVYGLDDAPLRWHHTVLKFFQGLGFERTLLESCWLVLRSHGLIVAMVLIEVDDINVACTKDYEPKIREAMKQRFQFGKWEESEADYAGRHVRVEHNRVVFDQEKYILEKLHPHKLPRGMLADKKQMLQGDDFEAHRSLLYKVNWVAHQTRPEAAGVVSILASRLKQATVHDLWCLNKMVSYLRNTAQQTLVLNKFDNQKMLFITAFGAASSGRHHPGSLGYHGSRSVAIGLQAHQDFCPILEIFKTEEACFLYSCRRGTIFQPSIGRG